MIRVVVTGSECTGKTTLAKALARHYDAFHVPEYLREFTVRKGGAPEYADIDAIARGQIELEDEHAAAGPDLLIQDTDLLSMVVYNNHYYGECPQWIDDALRARAGDLYLLAAIDVPWVADGLRDRPDRRVEMQALFRDALRVRRLPYVKVRGNPEERLAVAVEAVDRLRSD